MGYPGNIKFFEKDLTLFLHFRRLLLKFIKNDTIVNPFYLGLLVIIDIKKFFSLLL
jgi:hypothetical protein